MLLLSAIVSMLIRADPFELKMESILYQSTTDWLVDWRDYMMTIDA